MTERCSWGAKETLITYHDQEWGVPLHDDQKVKIAEISKRLSP